MVFGKSFKSKFGFISTTSLAVLSALVCSPGVYAMDEPDPEESRFLVHRKLMEELREKINAKKGIVPVQPEQNEEITLTLRPRGQQHKANVSAIDSIKKEVDYMVVVRQKILRAEQGDVEAQRYVADVCFASVYSAGKGPDNLRAALYNLRAALYFYKEAADQGDIEAQAIVDRMYPKFIDDTDEETSGAYYKMLADALRGNPEAQLSLGNMYCKGEGVEQDYKKAYYYYELLADQGVIDVECNLLGRMYYYGTLIARDYGKALKYYTLAAEQGNADADALCNLGHMYYQGKGVPKDYKKAIHYFTLAAEQGDTAAHNSLGNMYYYGHGVEKDYKKAIHYYELAANEEYPWAQYCLGLMYSRAQGVEQDCEKAFNYFKLAADQRDVDAQYQVGNMYADGQGVAQDERLSRKYFKAAANQGHELASKRFWRKLIPGG